MHLCIVTGTSAAQPGGQECIAAAEGGPEEADHARAAEPNTLHTQEQCAPHGCLHQAASTTRE